VSRGERYKLLFSKQEPSFLLYIIIYLEDNFTEQYVKYQNENSNEFLVFELFNFVY